MVAKQATERIVLGVGPLMHELIHPDMLSDAFVLMVSSLSTITLRSHAS
jgi:hypothetical protein